MNLHRRQAIGAADAPKVGPDRFAAAMFSLNHPIRTFLTFLLPLLTGVNARAELALHPDRDSPLDLAVTGGLAGVPPDSTRYVRYADIRALPTASLRLTGEFTKGTQEVTVVYLSELWRALPVSPDCDCLLCSCSDRYASVYRSDFISRYRPFLVVEIDGKDPGQWSKAGLAEDPGPYAITVSPSLVPEVDRVLSVEHKRPWGVVSIEFASFRSKFAGSYEGRWAGLSARAASGREIWINACASCHPGPGRTFSGTKSREPFAILAAIARGDPELFKHYVRDPTAVRPGAKMEPHPYFTQGQLDAVVAFVLAEH